MAVLRCANGHFYDNEKFSECPHCKNPLPQSKGLNSQFTVSGSFIASTPVSAEAVKRHIEIAPTQKGDEKTVGIFRTNKGYDPVVGWLVCVEGAEKGRDYRLHSGRNFIGRAPSSDVALCDDERVTRENHCSIVFEPRSGVFVIASGLGEGVTVNGERLEQTITLSGDDSIEVGASRFVFVRFCREGRGW